MTDTVMENRTNKNISSRNRTKRIFRNILMALTILLLGAAVVIAAMVLTGCSSTPDSYPAAEEQVKKDLDELKNTDNSDAVVSSLSEFVDENDGEAMKIYLDKVRDFDYEIMGSKAVEGTTKTAVVTVRINTYDFGNLYLKTWEDFIATEEWLKNEDVFDNLLFKFTSLTSKDFATDVDITCKDPEDNDNWETDINKDNEALMDALSGGMLGTMKSLAGDGKNGGESEEDE